VSHHVTVLHQGTVLERWIDKLEKPSGHRKASHDKILLWDIASNSLS